jgi:hypothetical protein
MSYLRNRHPCLNVTAALGLSFVAPYAAEPSDPPAAGVAREAVAKPQPAEWETFDILVDLHNLPRTYSCDELWYKFRGVLHGLGAGPDMTITPYDCGYVGGGQARSPHVEVKFELPRPVQGAAIRYAQMSVVEKIIRLAPGSPHSLVASDCEFASQLVAGFFPALPLHVRTTDFRCTTAPPSYALMVNARIVVPL